ncbi:NUMOD4 domain-containing protein [Paenibacillus montanisoli]|uniref:3-ketosteroid-delta-1-dehydrogenase n=1 Tax=Paenibacillus montanisoli TaxID=2081970 RepID=A0A328TV10_9BACL|nr:NUMOD4 domain-containing protein [Paenibacillus montanisoli]RAP74368.1 3-ketosteroid-delta-1-dehydrogenase [Paenibacillus montanisoli]
MNEERRAIEGYEEVYEITRSGRIISKRNNRVRHREGNEYGYEKVHLHHKGDRKLFRTFNLWEKVFPDADKSEYKGM